jgi:hypothetical protein
MDKIYKTISIYIYIYIYEAWPLILSEEHRFRTFENKETRRTSERGLSSGCRKVHQKELHNLYTSLSYDSGILLHPVL